MERPTVERPTAAVVKGRIKVADEVVEKVAALATMEVAGVVAMGGDPARVLEPERDRAGVGGRWAGQGVHVEIEDRQVAIDITIVVEYGRAILDVANEVKANVARAVSLMAGLRVVEVNVTIDDVRVPEAARPEPGVSDGPRDHLGQ